MRRKIASINNIKDIITSGIGTVNNVSIYEQVSKCLENVYDIESEKFAESIVALSDTVFADVIDWEYEITNSTFGEFMIIGYMKKSMGISAVCSAHLKVNKNISVNDVQKKLDETIFDRVPTKQTENV